MKIYREINSLADYETYSDAGDAISRLVDLGLDDEALWLAEKRFPNGCSEDEFESFLISYDLEKYIGWDFRNYDSREEYEEEEALATKEICEWDDR